MKFTYPSKTCQEKTTKDQSCKHRLSKQIRKIVMNIRFENKLL